MCPFVMISQEIQHSQQSGDITIPETHRVLIVDDEAAIRFAYRKLFESERFGFDICESVDTAISLLNKNEYFAVISDVRFSGTDNEDGVHFVSVVRKVQPLSKIILVTGYGSDTLKNTAYELGTSHYFEKPVMPSLILSLLRSLHLVADEIEENNHFKNLLLTKTLVS
jgi:DNA-binding NtrC family response regulator